MDVTMQNTKDETREFPLVSCIMPTNNRRAFVPKAIKYFLRQDYPNRQLIIIDDGTDAVRDLVSHEAQIHYIRLNKRYTIGAKRNIACEEAQGQIIAHWDDDDWMAPYRLSSQVETLLQEQADICGLDKIYFYEFETGKAWQYIYPGGDKPWLAGGTLCYRKNFWARNPFPSINVGEDTCFVWSNRTKKIVALRDNTFYVALVHKGNTSPKVTTDSRWHSCPPGDIRKIMGADWDLYSQCTAAQENIDQEKKIHIPWDHIIVSMPWFGSKAYLRRAVESVLAQTHTNLTLVVVNDGAKDPPWDELTSIDDPRLVRFDLPFNRGPYFSHDMVLRATGAPYLFIHDADDWSEPQLFSSLLRLMSMEHADGAISAARHHYPPGRNITTRIETYPELYQPLTSAFKHRANHHGVYKTGALRAIGGYYAGLRIGYDTMIINLLLMTGRLVFLNQPLYHRFIHKHSLTNAPATGMKSRARLQAADNMRRVYTNIYNMYNRYLAGNMTYEEMCSEICRISHQGVNPENEIEIQKESQRLRELLGTESSPTQSRTFLVKTQDCSKIIDAPGIPWNNWTINKPLARQLQRHLEEKRPKRLLEVGSGISTLIMADYARAHGAKLVSLEHEPCYHQQTKELLRGFKMESLVDLRLVPIKERLCSDNCRYPWYWTELKGPFDFVFVDGPPGRYGREANLFAIAPHLADQWELWLHDAARTNEKQVVSLWSRYFDFEQTCSFSDDPRGVFYLCRPANCPKRRRASEQPISELGIGIITGGRLNLLQRTIESFKEQNQSLLNECPVIVLVNGNDPGTQVYVDQLPFVDQCLRNPQYTLPIGHAASWLLRTLAGKKNVQTILHLEDDWQADGMDPDWLRKAAYILRNYPDVGQVRLRHMSENVLSYHMVTHHPIHWEEKSGFRLSQSAHYTFNPSLIRAREVNKIFPCRDEHEAQLKFLRSGFASAQLIPGVFRHIGGDKSLRVIMEKKKQFPLASRQIHSQKKLAKTLSLDTR